MYNVGRSYDHADHLSSQRYQTWKVAGGVITPPYSFFAGNGLTALLNSVTSTDPNGIGCGKCRKFCPAPDGCTLCGKCTFYCPADAREVYGKEYTSNEVLAVVIKDKANYENSGGGVTFSGCGCMPQTDFLPELLKKLHCYFS